MIIVGILLLVERILQEVADDRFREAFCGHGEGPHDQLANLTCGPSLPTLGCLTAW